LPGARRAGSAITPGEWNERRARIESKAALKKYPPVVVNVGAVPIVPALRFVPVVPIVPVVPKVSTLAA
jgi:hypothetical protein